MGLLDSIEGMARQSMAGEQPADQSLNVGQATDAGTNTKVAGGLMQALDEHPGGLSGILDHLKGNGMQQQAQNWSTGDQSTASPGEIHQGLAGSGLIDRVAAKAGVSPQVAEMAMATVLPLVLSHFTQGGQTAPPQSGFGGMASQILGRLL